MANEKHEVHLTEEERRKLFGIVSKGRNKAVIIQRAHTLLKVDEGKTDVGISQILYVSEETIRRIRLRFAQEGLQAALEDNPILPQVRNWMKSRSRPLDAGVADTRSIERWPCHSDLTRNCVVTAKKKQT